MCPKTVRVSRVTTAMSLASRAKRMGVETMGSRRCKPKAWRLRAWASLAEAKARRLRPCVLAAEPIALPMLRRGHGAREGSRELYQGERTCGPPHLVRKRPCCLWGHGSCEWCAAGARMSTFTIWPSVGAEMRQAGASAPSHSGAEMCEGAQQWGGVVLTDPTRIRALGGTPHVATKRVLGAPTGC